MAIKLKNINSKLYAMLHDNGFDPTPLDARGNGAGLPEEAAVFQVVTNGSPVTITVTSDRILEVRYSSKATEDDNWYDHDGLLARLREFRREHNLQGFEPEEQKDNKRLKYDMAKRHQMKQEELSLNEGYYPMGKRASYNDGIPTVKIVIQHNRQLGEGEQRFRNVEKIFIENADGERFRSPTNSPGLSKVFARLVAEGDKPHGEHWNHLVSLVEDYTKLRGFVRATKNGVFSEGAERWVQAGVSRYSELRESLKSLMTGRGYRAYFESWTPTLTESSDESGVDLTEMFKSSVLDARVEAALPVIKRLSVGLAEDASLTTSLEEWAGKVERDAVYGVEDQMDEAKSPEEFMKQISKPNPMILGNERADIHLTPSQWQLYTASPELKRQVAVAAQALNDTFNQLMNLPTATRDAVESGMYEVMRKYSSTGARDTEPREVLQDLLDKYFPEEGIIESGCDCGPDCDCEDCQEHNAPVKKNKKRIAVRESKVDIKLIESEFGPIQYKGGVFSRNQKLFKHLIEHFGNNDTRATNAFMYIVNQKIESDYKLPLSEEISRDDPLLNDIFDSFESLSGDHQYNVGDQVVALEISAMPFGKPKEVWIEGSYTPLTIEEITPTYVVFTNGHQKPVKRLLQLRLWNELVMFDSPESAEKAVTWMLLKAGEAEEWSLQSFVDENPVANLEEGYGDEPRGGRYGQIGRAKAVPVNTRPAPPAQNTETGKKSDPKPEKKGDAEVEEGKLTRGQRKAGQVGATEKAKSTGPILGQKEKKHPFQGRLVGASESAADPLAAIRRLSGLK